MSLTLILLLIFLQVGVVSTFHYLVYSPLFAYSHANFMGKVADTLAEAGHSVTVLCPIVAQKYRSARFVHSNARIVFFEASEKLIELAEQMESGDFARFWNEDSGIVELIPNHVFFSKMYDEIMQNVRNQKHILDSLGHHDVIIYEFFFHSAKVVQEYLRIPTSIPVTSVTHDIFLASSFGEPASPSFLSGYLTNFGNEMSLTERITNTIGLYATRHVASFPRYEALDGSGRIVEIESATHKSPFAFLNSNPLIDFPRPTVSKTVLVGGITVDVEKLKSRKLDDDWSNVLEEKKHNVLISFGSIFLSKDMPMSYKLNFIEVMNSMPDVTFIWKYESEDVKFARNASNVIFSKWVPQSAILADPRLSAFFTHAGLGSVNELSYLGKPAILCPLFADQLRNAKMLSRHNGSIEISKFDLSDFSALRSAFETVLFDESYSRNARSLADRLANQPVKPKQLLVRHAEFAAQFGEIASLDSNLRRMTFIEYFLIDVIFVISFCVFSFSTILYQTLKRVGVTLKLVKTSLRMKYD